MFVTLTGEALRRFADAAADALETPEGRTHEWEYRRLDDGQIELRRERQSRPQSLAATPDNIETLLTRIDELPEAHT